MYMCPTAVDLSVAVALSVVFAGNVASTPVIVNVTAAGDFLDAIVALSSLGYLLFFVSVLHYLLPLVCTGVGCGVSTATPVMTPVVTPTTPGSNPWPSVGGCTGPVPGVALGGYSTV